MLNPVTSVAGEVVKWLDANQLSKVEELNNKRKEGESVCNPIITKLYQVRWWGWANHVKGRLIIGPTRVC